MPNEPVSIIHAEPQLVGKYVTVVYRIEDPTEWRKTNPLSYKHDGLIACGVSIGDLMERRDDLRDGLQRIAAFSLDGETANEIAQAVLDKDDAHG